MRSSHKPALGEYRSGKPHSSPCCSTTPARKNERTRRRTLRSPTLSATRPMRTRWSTLSNDCSTYYPHRGPNGGLGEHDQLLVSQGLLECEFLNNPAKISSKARLCVEQLGDGHSGVALGAQPSWPYAPHKSEAFLAVLHADGPFTATFALINGVGPAWPGGRQFCDSLPGVPAPTVSGSPARPRAELLAAGGDERALADGAGHRDAIVTQQGIFVDFCGGATR